MNREKAQVLADKLMKDGGPDLKIKLSESHHPLVDVRFLVEVPKYRKGEVVGIFAVEDLIPEQAHWHTYRMFANAIQRAYGAGIRDGLELAAERLDKENRATILRFGTLP